MQLHELNDHPADWVGARLRACADVDSWVQGLLDARPYAARHVLMERAEHLALTWTEPDLDGALADHPRIGEQHTGEGDSAAMSAAEQGGVGDDASVRDRLADGNRRYEERFGRIYLVRAAGRDAEQLLDLLEQRLTHDDATEVTVALQQLAEIAMLRLDKLVDDAQPTPSTQESA